jgi:hypothetical protein
VLDDERKGLRGEKVLGLGFKVFSRGEVVRSIGVILTIQN